MSEKKLQGLFQLRNYILDCWRSDKKNFLGRVLTIIDASIADPQQRKGIKDLINDAFWSNDGHLEDEARYIMLKFGQKYCQDIKDVMPSTKDDEDVFLGKHPSVVAEEASPGYFN